MVEEAHPSVDRLLSLGLFMPNCSNMPSISTHEVVSDQWTYAENELLAQRAEALGFDYLFPVSRWRGFGGETNFLGTSLETTTWAAALLRATERINIFSTVHIPLFHPFVVAKMGATLAHMSGDRWGLNVVSGWSAREFGMMGVELAEHGRRYERTAAFIEILRGLWDSSQQPLNHKSDWYSVVDGEASPIPHRQPQIANAGTSADAQSMTARLCDWAFISTPSVEAVGSLVEGIASQAAAHHRRVKTAIFPFLLWAESRSEAEDKLAAIVAAKDSEAADNWLHDLTAGSGSFDDFTKDMLAASGGGVHLVGTAADIAEQLIEAHTLGVDAVMLTFPRYREDLERFARDIQPALVSAGIVAP
ncbi:MAG: LLM class flavin-dependent oxidoreductase [Halieaceae bacterium]|nr:LLM class flavin-dependent oxidoreductase [Halieaceae bacterium]MBT4853271.1 LLM class flavin-dependent oxidoreductase [Halieaceae bacterium]MBT5208821.1 LLM class flavin-dependent oxidoreductase [Halieaceae bacterium]MBT6265629.1 LLM class flavin-dependent oxidoreductase [Halieaceae bacterium]